MAQPIFDKCAHSMPVARQDGRNFWWKFKRKRTPNISPLSFCLNNLGFVRGGWSQKGGQRGRGLRGIFSIKFLILYYRFGGTPRSNSWSYTIDFRGCPVMPGHAQACPVNRRKRPPLGAGKHAAELGWREYVNKLPQIILCYVILYYIILD